MTDAKPIASLSPTLLARKGTAKPAMRPQLPPLRTFNEATARQIDDDLGWNDMGHDDGAEPEPRNAPDHAREAEVVPIHGAATVADAAVPEVIRQQHAIAENLAPAPARPRRSALARGRRAAFTLRLDAARHLELRLACTLSGQSAQHLVTEALDRLIAETPDIAALAAQLQQRAGNASRGKADDQEQRTS